VRVCICVVQFSSLQSRRHEEGLSVALNTKIQRWNPDSTGISSVRPAETVNCRTAADWPVQVDRQNLQPLDHILSCQTPNAAVYTNCVYCVHKCQLNLLKFADTEGWKAELA